MAFFDDLGKKLSQAGQNMAQKTKDFSEVNKLNSAISSEEKKINNIYLQLGKEYFTKHENDSEACFEQYVSDIKESKAKIETMRQQIQEIKKITRCEKCGADILNNAAFCSACGAPAPVKAPVAVEEGVMCPSCRQIVAVGTKFCTSCGSPMPVAEPAPVVSAQQTEPAPVPEQVQEETVFAVQEEEVTYAPVQTPETPAACPNCNAELLPGTSFCTNCGTRIN